MAIISGLIATKLVLWNLSISEFSSLLNIVASEETHNKSYKFEEQRYAEMWSIDSAYASLLFGLLIVSFVIAFLGWLVRGMLSKQANVILINYILIIIVPLVVLLIYLFFYPAKWYHYFSLAVPFLFISIHFWSHFFQARSKYTSAVIVGLVLVLSTLTLTKAVYGVLGADQYSYLKAAIFKQRYEFNPTSDGAQPLIYLDPFLVPFFKNIKIQSLDNFEMKEIDKCLIQIKMKKTFNHVERIYNLRYEETKYP
jgi:hypothetical protein